MLKTHIYDYIHRWQKLTPRRVVSTLVGHLSSDILSESSEEFDPEAHLELKEPPDPSEILIRRIFSKSHISIRTKR